MTQRSANVRRETRETRVGASIDLDGTGQSSIAVGVPFLEHMLDQFAHHGLVDLDIQAEGGRHVDAHHTVEDVGITLGQALAQALGDKSGIRRFGWAYVPLDEALSRVVVDCSGRPGLHFQVDFPRPRIGDFDVDLFREFFQGLVNHAWLTLHVDNLRGDNAHHIAETVFKAAGQALRYAVEADLRSPGGAPSTKGTLTR